MTRSFTFTLLFFASEAQAVEPLWSLKPLTQPTVPNNSGQTPVDKFLQAKLHEKNLAFSKPADPRVQVRRLYFDLIGLPPPPEVVEAFIKNPTDAAYIKLVDELLASPHYGERWARHWLDLVRYGESDGFEFDQPKPFIWRYRDYVIEAFNSDMPFDQFVRQQIAGDLVSKVTPDSLIATGYYRVGQWDSG